MKRLVVVGNGMAGMACLEQILTYAPRFEVTVFGDETHVNYNRIMLSSVLAGEKAADDIVLNSVEWYQRHGIDLRVGVRIVDVDAIAKTVTGSDGSVTPGWHEPSTKAGTERSQNHNCNSLLTDNSTQQKTGLCWMNASILCRCAVAPRRCQTRISVLKPCSAS